MSEPPALVPRNVTILDEAKEAVTGDRQASYGPPDQDFRRIAGMANALFADKLTCGLTPVDVAKLMILVKLSRETHQHKRDNAVDIAGYAYCMQACREAE
jgi:hypothetical protein